MWYKNVSAGFFCFVTIHAFDISWKYHVLHYMVKIAVQSQTYAFTILYV